jgi:hypothetical protein
MISAVALADHIQVNRRQIFSWIHDDLLIPNQTPGKGIRYTFTPHEAAIAELASLMTPHLRWDDALHTARASITAGPRPHINHTHLWHARLTAHLTIQITTPNPTYPLTRAPAIL